MSGPLRKNTTGIKGGAQRFHLFILASFSLQLGKEDRGGGCKTRLRGGASVDRRQLASFRVSSPEDRSDCSDTQDGATGAAEC